MMTVEREIGSIESANINKETLDAMKNASKAIQQIHGGLTVDQVDQTMEDLREQHAVGEEIAEALTQGAQTAGVDEDELDEELAELQQEQLDERMLKTGSVPVSDQINRMPSAPSRSSPFSCRYRSRKRRLTVHSEEHPAAIGRGGGRGSRAAQAAGRDGHVKERLHTWICSEFSAWEGRSLFLLRSLCPWRSCLPRCTTERDAAKSLSRIIQICSNHQVARVSARHTLVFSHIQ